jgi:hypothetical protein
MHGYAPYVADSVMTGEGSPEYPRHLRNFCSHSPRAAAMQILLFKKGNFSSRHNSTFFSRQTLTGTKPEGEKYHPTLT